MSGHSLAKKVYVAGTCDTKEEELLFAKSCVEAAGVPAVLVDVGTTIPSKGADFSNADVAAFHPTSPDKIFKAGDRGTAVSEMSIALERFLRSRSDIGAVLGLGGTGNTALVTRAMQSLPVGVPKLMLSTVASGNVAPYVGASDTAMMYSIVDIAGLNKISRVIIANAAHAVAGMAAHQSAVTAPDKTAVGLTMFGVTTAAITQIRALLEQHFDCFVFHATGIGGQSMETLLETGLLDAVIDLTTTEVPDMLVGGVFAATKDRFGASIRTKRPYLGSVGAVDMVNFGHMSTVPAAFSGRLMHVHNEQVTLMRTTPQENKEIGRWIASRLNEMEGPVRFLLPLRGVSALDAEGKPFWSPEANEALFGKIRETFEQTPNRRLVEIDAHINDPAFCAAVVENFRQIIQ